MQNEPVWSDYPNFSPLEFQCSHTGQVLMRADFLHLLQQLRTIYAAPLLISSGYRHPTHPRERPKAAPGPHTTGLACDVRIRGPQAHRLLRAALALGFTGIGINQRGDSRFIHLDTVPSSPRGPRPTVWSY